MDKVVKIIGAGVLVYLMFVLGNIIKDHLNGVVNYRDYVFSIFMLILALVISFPDQFRRYFLEPFPIIDNGLDKIKKFLSKDITK